MARKLRCHIRSNVVGYIALFFALGLGSAWAATELSKNDVKSRHIKNRGVKTKDLANNAVTSPKVADGSLLSEDFGAGQLPAGPQGERGPQGQPATKLFAYIKDDGSATTAAVEYGRGVTGVDDPAGDSGYTVTFNRDLSNCVAQAVSGFGHPSTGDFGAGPYTPILWMASPLSGSDPREVDVDMRPPSATSNATDTSFMISAFC